MRYIKCEKDINKLWGKYALDFAPDWVNCALRIIELYSNSSNRSRIFLFENKMRSDVNWNIESLDYSIPEEKRKVELKTQDFQIVMK